MILTLKKKGSIRSIFRAIRTEMNGAVNKKQTYGLSPQILFKITNIREGIAFMMYINII